jgi:hypothetical protein
MTMSGDLGTTNGWLAVLAVVSVVQMVIVGYVAIAALRFFKHASVVADDVQRHVEPLATRATAVLEDAHQLMGQVRATEASLRNTVGGVTAAVSRVGQAAQWKLWPAFGLARGLMAAVSALKTRSYRSRLGALDRTAQARLADDGGAHHAQLPE